MLLASLTWIVVPVVYAATYSFDVHRVLWQSALCASPSDCGAEGDEWTADCQCSLFYLRHLAILALANVCLIALLLLEILRTPNRPGVVLVR